MTRDSLSQFGILLVLVSALAVPFVSLNRDRGAPGKVVLRYLTLETGQEQQRLVTEIVRRFEAIHPKVHVEVEFNSNAARKLYVDLASGAAPDVFYCLSDDIPRMAARGVLLNQAPDARREGITFHEYFPKTVSGLKWNGGLYAYPIHFSTDVLFYNKSLFDAAGVAYPTAQWTWDDYVKAAQRLTRVGKDGRVEVFGTTLPDPNLVIAANGGRAFNADYTRCVVDNPRAAEALQMLRDLRDRYHVAPTPQQMQDTSSTQMFQTGRVAMLPGRTYMVIDFNKAIRDFSYDVALMPKLRRRVVRLAVGGTAIAARTAHPKEAWEFARFYGSASGGLKILGAQKNCVPAAKTLAYSPHFFLQGPPQNVRVFVDSVADAEIFAPPILNSRDYMTRIRDPYFDQIMRGTLPIGQGLARLQADTNKLLREM